MDLNTSVLIVSAYGRGHWLASALQRENIPVTVIDVSGKLGVWPPEDLEGPFGFFEPRAEDQSSALEPLQAEYLQAGDEFHKMEQGFTIWLPDGPVEMKTASSAYRLKKLRQPPGILEALQSAAVSNRKPNVSLQRALQRWATLNFEKSWTLNLAHQLSATTYHSNARAPLFGKSLKLMDSFSVRKATELGRRKSLEWLRSKKVEVLENTDILDFSFHGKKAISGVELHGERSGVLPIDQLVWMLNSEESYFVYPKIAHYLFPEGELEPEWCWVRYRLRFSPCQELQSLPAHLLVTEQVTAPWTHENLMVLQQSSEPTHFDSWIRIPNVQRFNKEYLRIRGEKILEILRRRLPLALPEIESFPQEFYKTHSQIGPSPFPVYANGLDSRRTRVAFSNLFLNASELWRNFSWDEIFETQNTIHTSLTKWWKLLQQKKEKERRD